MKADRDVGAFDRRAPGYDRGWKGRLHHEIAEAAAALASTTQPSPGRVLDVGCGTGYLLALLAAQYPAATELAGIDAAPAMAEVARAGIEDPRISVQLGRAEQLSFPDGHFGLVVSTTSFDHWTDQAAGLAECRRVLEPDGALVLVDLFARWFVVTMVAGRRGRVRTPGAATELLRRAGFTSAQWQPLYAGMIRAVVARP